MKHLATIFILLPLFLSCSQKSADYILSDNQLNIRLEQGTLRIIPLSDNAIRVQVVRDSIVEERELILVHQHPFKDFQFSDKDGKLQITTKAIQVIYDTHSGHIEYSDTTGRVFLREVPGSRILKQDTVMGSPCYLVEQGFDSPRDEFLFGLGQFQDGHYNVRGLGRKLIQVNSQIAIPFLYSSRGYGILWHQYGLTEYNPADNPIALAKVINASGDDKEVEVTTTAGTQKVSQRQALYAGKFTLDNAGEFNLMLDLGGMDNRHLVIIDDSAYIDQSNLWLPPAVSVKAKLSAGEHHVKVVCNSSNTPRLSWGLINNSTLFRSPNAKSLDYVVFYGDKADDVFTSYRNFSGHAPLLPKWAYGFWQCRERYTSSEHLIETVKEFRKRKLPLDVIVQDWQYWGSHGWGVPKLDESRYPNPDGFIKELHDLNARFAISIWSNPDQKSTIGQQYMKDSMYIPNTKWLDYFNPETSQRYWNTLDENLFSHGVDAWWMDATEPENDALTGTNTHIGPGDFYRLTYPLFVCQSVYDGQRKANPDKRVSILTRSAFAGQQRYGAINWSGDIGGTWDGYKRQIKAGMHYSLTGLPFWTTDIGGFFRPGEAQYTDKQYQELLTRWFQWGTFNTIFRIHGYQSETEPWKYGEEVERNIRKMLNVRYQLLPYIYSEAWQITDNASTMMRPLVMDFPNDQDAIAQPFEYMFGHSLLVAPVVEAGVSRTQVYLPKLTDWYDFWTGKKFEGGHNIATEAPLDQIPVFVKAGSIIPFAAVAESTAASQMDTLEIRVYTGANGKFVLYNDEGDNYNYEKGQYSLIPFEWNDKDQRLIIGDLKGAFAGMPNQFVFTINWFRSSDSLAEAIITSQPIVYSGKLIEVQPGK